MSRFIREGRNKAPGTGFEAKKRGLDRRKARMEKLNLYDLTFEEMISFVAGLGEKPYRAGQIMAWLYRRGLAGFQDMRDLSAAAREKLALNSVLTLPELAGLKTDPEDGARKMLWRLSDGAVVESVLMPEKGHYTVCLSSQVGCALGCRFCRTGLLGFRRNLRPSEILGQFLGAQRLVEPRRPLTNAVFMGMGEPLLNRGNLVRALGVITDPRLIALGKKHISVSTVGIVPEMARLARETDVCLTISLSAPTDSLRDQIMPINKKYPLAELKRALLAYPLPRGRRFTIAYVLLGGLNDSLAEARQLVAFLHGLKVKINLIPFNPWPGAPFEAPPEGRVTAFRDFLNAKHHTAMIRRSKGGRVGGACGQLAAGRLAE